MIKKQIKSAVRGIAISLIFFGNAWAELSQYEAAAKYSPYAIMSNNVYGKDQIQLPNDWEINQNIPGAGLFSGFWAEVYERKVNGVIVEVVMVFRGTEDDTDWKYGNLSSYQLNNSEQFAKDVQKKYSEYPGIDINVTGHSLGGALALHVAALYGYDAVVFNSSSMDGVWSNKGAGNIVRIEEIGDPLDVFRSDKSSDIQFNFTFEVDGSGGNHSMFNLASGMIDTEKLKLSINSVAAEKFLVGITAITQGGTSHIGSASLFSGYASTDDASKLTVIGSNIDPLNTNNYHPITGAQQAGYATNTQAFASSDWVVTSGNAAEHYSTGNSFGPITAPGGGPIVALNNAGVQETIMQKTVSIPTGVKQVTVGMLANFVTNEYPLFVGSQYNDKAVVEIKTGSGNIYSATLFNKTLNSANFTNVSNLPAPMYPTGGQTGFENVSKTISVANGGKLTITVKTTNVGDTAFPSATLINKTAVK